MKSKKTSIRTRELICGRTPINLVFMTREKAVKLVALQRASGSRTWGEFKSSLPIDVYEQYVEDQGLVSFDRFYDKLWAEKPYTTPSEAMLKFLEKYDEDERVPADDESFDVEYVFHPDGIYPDWPEGEMATWVPLNIQAQFGVRETTSNGWLLTLDREREEEIVAAFVANGFKCVKDEALVCEACGY